MPYVIDPSEASVVFSSKLYDLSYTDSGLDLSPILWPVKSVTTSWSDFSPVLPTDPVLPLGIENFNTSTSNLWNLLSTTDPRISYSEVAWGDSTTGITFYWTPSVRYSTQADLEAALDDLVNSNQNGTLDRVVAYENGEKLLEATFTDTSARIDIGELSLELLGQWKRGFQDLLEYGQALNDYASLIEYALDGLPERLELKAQTLAILDQYRLDQTTIRYDGEIALQITDSTTGSSIKVGNAELYVTGRTSRDLGDLLDFVEALDTFQTLLDAAGNGTLGDYTTERAFAVDLLSKYALYEAGYRLDGETLIAWKLNSDEISLEMLGASISLQGEFPVTDYGQLFDVALDVYATDFNGVPNFDSINGLDLNTIEVSDELGEVVIGAYAPPTGPSPTVADVGILQGTTGSDEFVYDEFTRNVLARVIDLDDGDDIVKFSSDDELWAILDRADYINIYGYTSAESEYGTNHNNAYFSQDITESSVAVEVFGGAGYDEIRLLEHDDDWSSYYLDYVTELTIDFGAGTIVGKNREAIDGKIADVTIHDIRFQDIERISFENGQTIRAIGDTQANELAMHVGLFENWYWNGPTYTTIKEVTSQSVPKDFVFDGGAGNDTLIVTSDQAFDPLAAMNEAMNKYSGVANSSTDYLFSSTTLDSQIQLKNVELIRFESEDGRQQTVTVSDFAGTTAYNGGIDIIGTAIDGQRLTVDIDSIRDADGLGDLSYSWHRDYVEVSTAASYSLTQDDIGASIMLEVEYTDGAGNREVLSDVLVTSVAGYDRGDASTYISQSLHLADSSKTKINHGAVEIITSTQTISTANYYWGTDIPLQSLAPDEEFSMRVAADLKGSVEISDVIAQLRHIVGLSTLTGLSARAADGDGDGSVGISDVIQNLRTIVGLDKPTHAKVCDAQAAESFTLDSLDSVLYVVAPGDVDLSWAPGDLV